MGNLCIFCSENHNPHRIFWTRRLRFRGVQELGQGDPVTKWQTELAPAHCVLPPTQPVHSRGRGINGDLRPSPPSSLERTFVGFALISMCFLVLDAFAESEIPATNKADEKRGQEMSRRAPFSSNDSISCCLHSCWFPL